MSRWWPEREVIGPPECPIMYRWTLHDGGEHGVKLMVHRFLPNVTDKDVHDHPRPFWTFIVRGGYDDLVPCALCNGKGSIPAEVEVLPVRGLSRTAFRFTDSTATCPMCAGRRVVLHEILSPRRLRFRPARYRHITRTGPKGAWTVVLMGPFRRRWGFWRDGRWWYWKDYEREFGLGFRCE